MSAIEQSILRHAEEVEYMKELARQTAQQLLEDADVGEIIHDPEAFVERLLAVLLAELGPYARRLAEQAATYAEEVGLQELEAADIDRIADEAEMKFTSFATPALRDAVNAIVARIHDMAGAGVALTTIGSAVTSPAARAALIAPLLGAARRMVSSWIQFVDRDVNDTAIRMLAAADTQDDGSGDELQPLTLTWVAVMDRNTCGDDKDLVEHFCRPRHGLGKTLEEWTALGLPGSPVLECSIRSHRGASPCRCLLSTDERTAEITAPVSAGDAVKRGRDRAAADVATAKKFA